MIENPSLMYGILAVLLPVLLFIFYEDMRTRTIGVFTLIALLVTGLCFSACQFESLRTMAVNFVLNLLFVGMQLLIIGLYALARPKLIRKPTGVYIGAGDILFWLAITPLFPFTSFYVHFVGSLLVTLILHTILSLLQTYNSKLIPLCGMQSLYLVTVLILEW